jgi:hypothetical protein
VTRVKKVVGRVGLVGARGLVGVSFLCFVAVAVAVCGSSTPTASPSNSHTVAAKNYANNCASVADCFAVYEGPVGCCGGGCPNAAIRADAVPKYTSDFNTATPVCNPRPPCAAPGLGCNDGRVACVSGACAFETSDASAPD